MVDGAFIRESAAVERRRASAPWQPVPRCFQQKGLQAIFRLAARPESSRSTWTSAGLATAALLAIWLAVSAACMG